MTTPSSSSLSHALNPPTAVQKPQTELPRLQLAPPEHQKHLQTQAQARQQQDSIRQTASISPAQRRPDERAASQSSSREVSPAVGVEITQPATGDKRKPSASRLTSSKKRRTDQVPEEVARDPSLQYGLGTHYPYAYGYPGAPPPPPVPSFNPPAPPNTTSEMSFNEFQWRLLNLCGEFYEAATELIRATPHLVLSQAFQLLNRGTGLDPITVLNDARRTCDMLLANPQVLATPPPLPTALPLPVLSSLAHLNSRASASAASTAAVPPPSYPQQTQDMSALVDKSSQQGKEKDRQPNNVQGTWKDHEVQKLKMLAEKYRIRDKAAVAQEEEEEEDMEDGEGIAEGEGGTHPSKKTTIELGDIDWDKVVAEFGDERSRHQVLIKATYLGLKPSSTLPGKKPKKKKNSITTTEPPPPTFSSASAKSIPVGYTTSQLDATQSPSSPEGPTTSSTGPVPPPAAPTPLHANSSSDSHRPPAPPPPVPPPQHPQHTPAQAHTQYPQTGWYPHPQNPYYAYHQPVYYSAHPPTYGLQNFMPTPPQQGYFGQSFPLPATEPQSLEKQAQGKGKRKEIRKTNGPASGSMASSTPIPPPSLPAKIPIDSSSAKPSTTTGGPLSTDAPGSAGSTPRPTPAVPPGSTPTGSSGVLRRGPNSALFTYTPLPHGGGTSTDQNK